MTALLLRIIDSDALVHALSYLSGDLDDLIHMAATCTEAKAFILAHWASLKPDAAFWRNRFLAELPPALTALCQVHYRELFNLVVERVPQVVPESTTTTRTVALAALQYDRLPLETGRAVQSMRIVGLGNKSSPEINIYAGGMRIIRISHGLAQLMMEEEDDGSLELMQFLKHFNKPTHHDLIVVCSVDAHIVVTDAAACDHVRGVPTIEPIYEWGITDFVKDSFSDNRSVAGPQLVHKLPLYFEGPPTEFISFHYASADYAYAPRVKWFTLVVLNTEQSSKHSVRVPGWACRQHKKKNSAIVAYRIPINRKLSFSYNSLCFWLEVEFDRLDARELEVHIGQLRCNIMRQMGGLCGMAYNV